MKQGKNWKQSFTVFANPMVCHCHDVIESVPEKIIWHLLKVKKQCKENQEGTPQTYWLRRKRHCKEHGIRLSGPKLGRPSANAKVDKKQEYQDNTDRIEVERTLSLIKRCYGMSCITTKLEETQLTSIALSVFVTNLFRIQRRILYALLHLFRFWHDWNRCKSWKLQIDT